MHMVNRMAIASAVPLLLSAQSAWAEDVFSLVAATGTNFAEVACVGYPSGISNVGNFATASASMSFVAGGYTMSGRAAQTSSHSLTGSAVAITGTFAGTFPAYYGMGSCQGDTTDDVDFYVSDSTVYTITASAQCGANPTDYLPTPFVRTVALYSFSGTTVASCQLWADENSYIECGTLSPGEYDLSVNLQSWMSVYKLYEVDNFTVQVTDTVIVPQRPFFCGSEGWVRSKAWIGVFSSTHRTRACSGGWRYKPTTATTGAANWRSVPNFSAINLFAIPAAAFRTMLARNTSRAGVLRPRDQRSRVGRSSSLIVTLAAIRTVVSSS